MKHLAYTLAIAGLVGFSGTLAVAQSNTDAASMTCADFVAMSADEQRAALDSLNSADAGTEALADTETDLSADTDAGTADTDAGTDLSAETDTDVGTSTNADAGTSDAADTAAADTTVADPEVEAVIAACEGNDDALVADQMTP